MAGILLKKYEIYSPVNVHDEAVFSKYHFRKIDSANEIELHYPITPVPPTKYLFPPREKVLEFKGQANQLIKQPAQKPIIIFGLNVFDLLGISCLDREFSSPISDEKYLENRKNTLLFSVDHMDPPKEVSYDIHFKKIQDEEYEAITSSEIGREIVTENKNLFIRKKRRSKKEYHPKNSPVHHPEISEIVAKSKDDPIWDKLAEICFGCGICTYVCPVCYCFETEDEVKIDDILKCAGCRQRRWDSCMGPDFASISSHDFRPELRNRIYNWYHHKFVRTPKEHGFVGCVDCDRCIIYCPARINFHETLAYLIKKYS